MVFTELMGGVGLFGGIIIGAVLILGFMFGVFYIPPFYAALAITAICALSGLMLFLTGALSGGLAGTFVGARLRSQPIGIILRNDKALRFVTADITSGMAHTKRYGYFMLLPDSVYSMPNGTTGFLAYYKYGVSLSPKFVRAVSRLKSMGFKSIRDVQGFNNAQKEKGQQSTIKLDYNPEEEK